MLYAKVVLGISVEGPFDYIVPVNLHKKIKVGSRVWVSFRTRRALGYVVRLTRITNIKNLKNILEVIDDSPILDKNMLSLTKELSDYYCCSWGEAIETALPQALRKGKLLPDIDKIYSNKSLSKNSPLGKEQNFNKKVMLIHDLNGLKRWERYIQEIKMALENNQSVIILLPDIDSVIKTEETIKARIGCSLGVLYRKQARDLQEWIRVKKGEVSIVIGTRASIFAPFNNLGLVIIDEEGDHIYKQDQVPHYNAREVAFMRIDIEKAKLILGSTSPSLESLYLAKKSKIQYLSINRTRVFPEIKIMDTRKNIILSRYLEDSIFRALNSKGKILLFLNRKGFATFASCQTCGAVLKCPRCNINLVYHFKNNVLNCHYCNFKMHAPQMCPDCKSGYIKYAGTGTEKVESELSRIFPEARIKRLDNLKEKAFDDADIFISTESIIGKSKYNFVLIGTLFIDNSLNRIDFRSSEKTFGLLTGLLGLTEGKIVIQTSLPHHHVFRALVNKDMDIFYNEELRQRKQLTFPPYQHIALVKLRGAKESRAKEASISLFNRLKECNKNKTIKIISVNPGYPSKLRGNFYWQILIRADSAKKISKFLKKYLRDFSHSGIIVTVDIDPL